MVVAEALRFLQLDLRVHNGREAVSADLRLSRNQSRAGQTLVEDEQKMCCRDTSILIEL